MKISKADNGKIIWNLIFKPNMTITVEYDSAEEAAKEFERIKRELEVMLEVLGKK